MNGGAGAVLRFRALHWVPSLALFSIACGAAPTPASRPESPSAVSIADVDAGPAPVRVELTTSEWATIEIVQPDEGGVHRCMFLLRAGHFVGWDCYPTSEQRFQPLAEDAAARVEARLAEVDDWREPLGESDAADARPVTITLCTEGVDVTRFGVTIADEPPHMSAFRVAAMSTAQEALRSLRSMGETCSGCRDGEYCEEGYVCSTLGPDSKNCAVAAQCHRRLPATSACQHDYECRSRHCEGRATVAGTCG